MKRRRISPGEVIREEFMMPVALGPYQLARELLLEPAEMDALLTGEMAVTPAIAGRLGRRFRTTSEFWLNLQRSYDEQA